MGMRWQDVVGYIVGIKANEHLPEDTEVSISMND